jgi:Flp pilus assembly protein TadD
VAIEVALATELVDGGQTTDARTLLEAVLQIAPDDPEANYLLAGLRGDVDQAESELRTALATRPVEPRYLAALGALLLETGRAAEAAAVLGEARRFDPSDVHVENLFVEAQRRLR